VALVLVAAPVISDAESTFTVTTTKRVVAALPVKNDFLFGVSTNATYSGKSSNPMLEKDTNNSKSVNASTSGFEIFDESAKAPKAVPPPLAVKNDFLFGAPTGAAYSGKTSMTSTVSSQKVAPTAMTGGFAIFDESAAPEPAPKKVPATTLPVKNDFLFGAPTGAAHSGKTSMTPPAAPAPVAPAAPAPTRFAILNENATNEASEKASTPLSGSFAIFDETESTSKAAEPAASAFAIFDENAPVKTMKTETAAVVKKAPLTTKVVVKEVKPMLPMMDPKMACAEPTMTMFSKEAFSDVMDMFDSTIDITAPEKTLGPVSSSMMEKADRTTNLKDLFGVKALAKTTPQAVLVASETPVEDDENIDGTHWTKDDSSGAYRAEAEKPAASDFEIFDESATTKATSNAAMVQATPAFEVFSEVCEPSHPAAVETVAPASATITTSGFEIFDESAVPEPQPPKLLSGFTIFDENAEKEAGKEPPRSPIAPQTMDFEVHDDCVSSPEMTLTSLEAEGDIMDMFSDNADSSATANEAPLTSVITRSADMTMTEPGVFEENVEESVEEVDVVDPFCKEEKQWMSAQVLKKLSVDKDFIQGGEVNPEEFKIDGNEIDMSDEEYMVGKELGRGSSGSIYLYWILAKDSYS